MNNKSIKSGISLIVLVITIIVIIILAGSVILSLSSNNPIAQAKEATFKTNVGEYKSELALAISKEYLLYPSFDSSIFDKGIWDGISDTSGTIKQYITSITVADAKKFVIQDSKLVYVGSEQTEKDWLSQLGIANSSTTLPSTVVINVIATANSTINGQAASYNNPIVPKGFKAINDVTTWPTDWDEGLVIEDISGNQFVWVPVNGTTVTYAKWCTTNISYTSTTDDTLPTGFSETNITTKYKGFYIARYESMFDYNGGSIRVASKKSTNKTISNWVRDSLHTGYLFNFVNYTDSKTYSENMATSYGYDTSKVGTNLITGAQWDTTMKWIQNTGTISVTDSRAWGNHGDSIAPANVGNGSIQISGYNNSWKAKNIYDLAGNTWEWTNEIYNSSRVYRGGVCSISGSTGPATCRYNDSATGVNNGVGFRAALYIL